MVNGGRVERQKIASILTADIKFRQELTKETHLLGSGQGTALKAGRLTWKRKAESTEKPLRQMDDGFPSSTISFFIFVCCDLKQGDRFLRVLGAEGRRSVAG